jgi:hypothetical protein
VQYGCLALFIITENLEEVQRPMKSEHVKKPSYTYAIEYYVAFQTNEL